ncbi:MAG: hypothetical protein NT033_09335, partial [Candidatus Omnitrophica bacterium]|nr:hypothetical protein [Candidatus Omnitrophota bacterium]
MSGILKELKNIIGEERLKEIIAPTLIPNPKTDKDIGGEFKFIQLDGALAAALLNLNAFFVNSNDARVKALLAKSGTGRLLNIVNASESKRTHFFTPVKEATDYWFQNHTDYYNKISTETWMLSDSERDLVPPIFNLVAYKRDDRGELVLDTNGDPIDSKFYNNVQNVINSLGTKASVKRLRALNIIGTIKLPNETVLKGTVNIASEYPGVFDFNSTEARQQLGQPGAAGISLEDVSIKISKEKALKVEPIKQEDSTAASLEIMVMSYLIYHDRAKEAVYRYKQSSTKEKTIIENVIVRLLFSEKDSARWSARWALGEIIRVPVQTMLKKWDSASGVVQVYREAVAMGDLTKAETIRKIIMSALKESPDSDIHKTARLVSNILFENIGMDAHYAFDSMEELLKYLPGNQVIEMNLAKQIMRKMVKIINPEISDLFFELIFSRRGWPVEIGVNKSLEHSTVVGFDNAARILRRAEEIVLIYQLIVKIVSSNDNSCYLVYKPYKFSGSSPEKHNISEVIFAERGTVDMGALDFIRDNPAVRMIWNYEDADRDYQTILPENLAGSKTNITIMARIFVDKNGGKTDISTLITECRKARPGTVVFIPEKSADTELFMKKEANSTGSLIAGKIAFAITGLAIKVMLVWPAIPVAVIAGLAAIAGV